MIYVDTTNRMLHLFCRYSRSEDIIHKKYDVALGTKDSPTPEGSFHVIHKIICPPLYYCDLKPGDAKWLGVASMELNINYDGRPYAIHGCNPDINIADQHTSGCIAMAGAGLVEVFNWIKCGCPVGIWYKPCSSVSDIPPMHNYNRLKNWPKSKARPLQS